jgi:hypothetical protein
MKCTNRVNGSRFFSNSTHVYYIILSYFVKQTTLWYVCWVIVMSAARIPGTICGACTLTHSLTHKLSGWWSRDKDCRRRRRRPNANQPTINPGFCISQIQVASTLKHFWRSQHCDRGELLVGRRLNSYELYDMLAIHSIEISSRSRRNKFILIRS